MKHLSKDLMAVIVNDISGSDMFNMMGIVSISAVRHRCNVPVGISDHQIRQFVCKQFDGEITGGVRFKEDCR